MQSYSFLTTSTTPSGFTLGTRREPQTAAELVAIEPRLAAIFAEAKRHQRCRNKWPVYGRLKKRLASFVGWDAINPRLATSDVYDLAIGEVVKALGV